MLVDTKVNYDLGGVDILVVPASELEAGLPDYAKLILGSTPVIEQIPRVPDLHQNGKDLGPKPIMGYQLRQKLEDLKSQGAYHAPGGQARLHGHHSHAITYT
ncbi:MAG: hypothetical protein Q7S88_03095 [Candidatus Daviesbacteria bacterium]|nr:hypothetical protein [Candidatus Daviesbacteria bacterium]